MKKRIITVRAPVELVEAVGIEAARHGRSFSQEVILAMSDRAAALKEARQKQVAERVPAAEGTG
ncbi:MAG: hypothetical protein M3355_08605 [Actinomycetota bacterium]|nr:hypothetical protein [Actinomycetota bacterium]